MKLAIICVLCALVFSTTAAADHPTPPSTAAPEAQSALATYEAEVQRQQQAFTADLARLMEKYDRQLRERHQRLLTQLERAHEAERASGDTAGAAEVGAIQERVQRGGPAQLQLPTPVHDENADELSADAESASAVAKVSVRCTVPVSVDPLEEGNPHFLGKVGPTSPRFQWIPEQMRGIKFTRVGIRAEPVYFIRVSEPGMIYLIGVADKLDPILAEDPDWQIVETGVRGTWITRTLVRQVKAGDELRVGAYEARLAARFGR